MRIPSRRMPKAFRRGTLPTRVFAWMLLLAMAGAYVYELWYHPLIVGFSSAFVAVVVIRERRRTMRHLANLAQALTGETICDFSRSFDARQIDTWVIRAVHENFSNSCGGLIRISRCVPQTGWWRI